MDKLEIPKFGQKEGLFEFLVENKDILIAEKKFELKKADAMSCLMPSTATKAAAINPNEVDKLAVKLIINTTKLFDSHSDVHIDGLWKRTLKANKGFYLLQEHQMKFDKIISDVDEVRAYAEIISWKELGFRFKGETQALVFEAIIDKSRNEFMFNQYAKGFVKNHSVGMRYVQLALAVNSDSNDFKEEKKVWDKYAPEIANLKDAEEKGFFWAVTEAKVIEGSAVVRGSNFATPTQSVESKEEIVDPSEDTQQKDDPSVDTRPSAKRKMLIRQI